MKSSCFSSKVYESPLLHCIYRSSRHDIRGMGLQELSKLFRGKLEQNPIEQHGHPRFVACFVARGIANEGESFNQITLTHIKSVVVMISVSVEVWSLGVGINSADSVARLGAVNFVIL
jgi:hypothetical protein